MSFKQPLQIFKTDWKATALIISEICYFSQSYSCQTLVNLPIRKANNLLNPEMDFAPLLSAIVKMKRCAAILTPAEMTAYYDWHIRFEPDLIENLLDTFSNYLPIREAERGEQDPRQRAAPAIYRAVA